MSALECAAPPATQAAPRLSRPFIATLMLANFGTNVALIAPIQNILPRMIESASGSADKAIGLGLVTGLGAFAALVFNPLAGHYSDRWVSTDNRTHDAGHRPRHRRGGPPGPRRAALHRRDRHLVDALPGHDQHRVRADVGDRGGPRRQAVLGARVGADLGRAGGGAHRRPRRGRAGVPLGHRRDDRHLRRLRRLPGPADRGAVPAAPGQLRVAGLPARQPGRAAGPARPARDRAGLRPGLHRQVPDHAGGDHRAPLPLLLPAGRRALPRPGRRPAHPHPDRDGGGRSSRPSSSGGSPTCRAATAGTRCSRRC